jgi:hypothetical protein
MRRTARALHVGITVTSLSLLEARAEASPSSKLVYIRGAGAEACPDEESLRKAVAARLGYDPFFPYAPQTVVAEVARDQGRFRGKIQIVAKDGKLRGARDLSTTEEDCAELVRTMGLAISIAIDDLDVEETPKPEAPVAKPASEPPPFASEVPPPPTAQSSAPEPPKSPPKARADFTLSAGPTLSLGTAPSPALGGSVALALGYRMVALRASFRGELDASGSFSPGGTVSTSTMLGGLEGCIRGAVPFVCAGAGLGRIATETSGIAHGHSDNGLLVTALVTAGARVSLARRWYFEPALEGAANFVEQRVEVDGRRVYTVPRIAGNLAIHVGFVFF